MKRLVVYYSLSGNTKEAAEDIAKALDADLVRLDTVKPMPKSYAAQILVGGGQVAMNKIPKIKKIDADQYNDINNIVCNNCKKLYGFSDVKYKPNCPKEL